MGSEMVTQQETARVEQIMKELEALGSATTKRVLLKHGAKEPLFAVKVGDLKPIQKRIKQNYALALGLYATGNSDAMYLAGLIADDMKMTREDLNRWAEQAPWSLIAENTVAWVAAGSQFGYELALEWIDSPHEIVATCGWATLSSLVGITEDAKLDVDGLRRLLQRVEKTLQAQPNRVRSTMNGFVISVATYVRPLTDRAIEVATNLGKVTVDVGDTACKVPDAVPYIQKCIAHNPTAKKRKTAKC